MFSSGLASVVCELPLDDGLLLQDMIVIVTITIALIVIIITIVESR
jgi:hypothetical protein